MGRAEGRMGELVYSLLIWEYSFHKYSFIEQMCFHAPHMESQALGPGRAVKTLFQSAHFTHEET